jgi:hypothetical protein
MFDDDWGGSSMHIARPSVQTSIRVILIAALVWAVFAAFTPQPAHAGKLWPPIAFNCPAGEKALMKYWLGPPYQVIGYGKTDHAAGLENETYIYPDIDSVYTGLNSGYWQRWNLPSNVDATITDWKKKCVAYS